jgi:hypothetical protein
VFDGVALQRRPSEARDGVVEGADDHVGLGAHKGCVLQRLTPSATSLNRRRSGGHLSLRLGQNRGRHAVD